ncbi:MAG: cell division protein FtsL [Gammaproteobacteria bacterium]|nr:cell division protein FtsL [Gammaproteobacteria bacterium]MDH5728101.1 cell division protein FtsL [Gammaproteobacteria bacterium]
MSNVTWQRVIGLSLVLAVFATALGLVWVRHENRVTYAELQNLQQQRDQYNIEWGQLQLEQSTFTAHGVVEQVAHQRLDMVVPGQDQIKLVSQ